MKNMFISYSLKLDDHTTGFGNSVIEVERAPYGYEDLRMIEKAIVDKLNTDRNWPKISGIVLLNYQIM